MSVVEYEKKNHIAYITMNRPDKLNALNMELVEGLAKAWMDFKEDRNLWVAIYSGEGRSFCVGVDISAISTESFDEGRSSPATFHVWKPVIAAVHGHVLGFGLWNVLCCDLRIAAEDAQFGLPEAGLNMASARSVLLTYYLPRSVAYELYYTRRRLNAQRAYELGMINEVVPRERLLDAATKMAQEICESGPLAVWAVKEALLREMGYEAAAARADKIVAPVRQSEDRKEAVRAFKEKRKPEWKVR